MIHAHEPELSRGGAVRALARASPLVLVLILLFISARHSYFFADDFLNFSTARELGLTPELLNRQLFGHWIPGRRLLDWIVQANRPISWDGVIGFVVVLVGVSALLLRRLAFQLTARPLLSWAVATMLPVTSATAATAQWWSGAAEPIAALPFLLASCIGLLSFLRHRRWWALALALLCLAAAVLFDERTVPLAFVFPVLVWIVDRPRRTLRVIACVTAIGALAIGWYLVQRGFVQGAEIPPHPGLDTLVEFTSSGIVQNVLPSLVGVYARPVSSIGGVPGLWFVGAAVLAGGLLLALSFRRHNVVLPLAWFIATATAIFAATGYIRAEQFGASSALEPRYAAILMPFGLLAVACALSQIHPVFAAGNRRTVVAAVLALSLSLPGWGLVVLANNSIGGTAHAWIDRYRETASRYPGQPFFDADVAAAVVPSLFFPASLLSRVLPTIDPTRSTHVTGPTALMIAKDGTVSRGRITPVGTMTIAETSGLTADPASGAGCLRATTAAPSISFLVSPPLPNRRWFLQLQTTLDRSSEVRIIGWKNKESVNVGPNGIDIVHAAEGASTITAGLSSNVLGWVRAEFGPVKKICLSESVIGGLTPVK